MESQISSIVNQYGNAPLGESPANFDASQLDHVPELGPREINLDIVSPSQFQPRLDPIPIRNLELLWKIVIPRCARLMQNDEVTPEEVLASVVMDMYVTIRLVQEVYVDCYY